MKHFIVAAVSTAVVSRVNRQGTRKKAASRHCRPKNGGWNVLLVSLATLSCQVPLTEILGAPITTGDMWVTDNADAVDSGRILKITPAGVATVAVSAAEIDAARTVAGDVFSEGTGARFTDNDIVFDAYGNFYFTESVSDGLFRINQYGGLVQLVKESDITAKTQESGASPQCIAAGSGTQLYVTDNYSDSVLSINRITGEVEILVSEVELESALGVGDIDLDGGISLSPDETKLYVVNTDGNDSVIEIDISGTSPVITQLADESDFPGGVADLYEFITTAPNGDILVVEDYVEQIIRVPANGDPLSVFLSETIIEDVLGHDVDPTGGIDFDLDGNFFLAQSANETGHTDAILKWFADDPSLGTIDVNSGIVFIREAQILADIGDPSGEVDFVGGFTFVPVTQPDPLPEPSSIAMLGLGATILGSVWYCRRRKQTLPRRCLNQVR